MTLKKVFKTLALIILSFILFIGFYFAAAFGLSRISVGEENIGTDDVTIYLLTNGVHTDLVLPIKNDQIDWSQHMKFENTVAKDTAMNYIAIGWGDKGFYLDTPTWAELKFSTAFKAATGLSTAAIHTTYYKTITEGKDCKKIEISKDQYAKMIKFIHNDLIKDSDGNLTFIDTDAVYGKNDAFYDAKGSYHLFHTCNTWTNRALKSCGQKACLWTPFDTGIFYQYE